MAVSAWDCCTHRHAVIHEPNEKKQTHDAWRCHGTAFPFESFSSQGPNEKGFSPFPVHSRHVTLRHLSTPVHAEHAIR